jgi:hypothetical protein
MVVAKILPFKGAISGRTAGENGEERANSRLHRMMAKNYVDIGLTEALPDPGSWHAACSGRGASKIGGK